MNQKSGDQLLNEFARLFNEEESREISPTTEKIATYTTDSFLKNTATLKSDIDWSLVSTDFNKISSYDVMKDSFWAILGVMNDRYALYLSPKIMNSPYKNLVLSFFRKITKDFDIITSFKPEEHLYLYVHTTEVEIGSTSQVIMLSVTSQASDRIAHLL